MEECCKKGQTFLDMKAGNYQGEKPKYFIALTQANDLEDEIVCLVINSENRMTQYKEGCNKAKGKYILKPKELSFINHHSSIMLDFPCRYYLKELFENKVKLMDIASDVLCRQIKNCINFDTFLPRFGNMIKDCFKDRLTS